MKIIAVIPSLSHGGAERVLSLLSKEWEKAHCVTLVAFDGRESAYRFGGAIIDLGLRRTQGLVAKAYVVCASISRLARIFRKDRPDRILSFMEPANFPVVVAATLVGVRNRVAVSVHHDPVRLSKFRQILIPWLYRAPLKVISVSQGVRDALISLKVVAKCVSTIYNPVDGSSARRAIQSPLSREYVLGVGRLHRDKGFDRLLRSFAMMKHDDVHLMILGDGVERTRLESLTRELGVASRVTMGGTVENISEWYQHAQCLVVSSRTEAWALVIVEAMANGCPVVSFACSYGPSEIIEHGVNGLLAPDGDVDALSREIDRVISDRFLRQRLSRAGVATAAAYDVRRVAPLWLRYPDNAWRERER